MYADRIRENLGKQNQYLRHLTVSFPTGTGVSGGASIEVIIDAQQAGTVVLLVRSGSLRPGQAEHLIRSGLEDKTDPDDIRKTVYVRTIHGDPRIQDLVTFVEWAFICVVGAPPDYEPTVKGLAEDDAEKQSCGKSCLTVVRLLLVVGVIAGIIYAFMSN